MGTSIPAGFMSIYFLRANSTETILETNVIIFGKIEPVRWFQVHRIGVHYSSGSSTLVEAADVSQLAEGSLLSFTKDRTMLFQLPTFVFHGGWGVYANTMPRTLPFPIDLFNTSTFEVEITYPKAITLSDTVYVWVVLEGIRTVVRSEWE